MQKKMKLLCLGASFFVSASAMPATICEIKLKELQGDAIAAKYEQLPQAQKSNFLAQLSLEQQLSLMAARSGHQLGAAIANNMGTEYKKTLSDIFEEKKQAFIKECGFMLQ
jgi:Mg/Co/Ni transporter MgtE